MARSIDDIIDLAVGVFMAVVLLGQGTWCWHYLVNLYHQPLIEKTAPTVTTSVMAPAYRYTGVDCLLGLVTYDENSPAPTTITFVDVGDNAQAFQEHFFPDNPSKKTSLDSFLASCGTVYKKSVTFDNEWYNQKETKLKEIYPFFENRLNYQSCMYEYTYTSDGTTVDTVYCIMCKQEVKPSWET